MLFNVRGVEIDVALPKSLAEVNSRIEKLVALHQKLQAELKKLPPKSVPRQIKGQEIHTVDVELQILKRWRRNANIRLEKLIADPDVGSGELETEAGLIKHLYQELRRVNREHRVSIERDSKLSNVLSAAQLWLRNDYSTKLPSADLVNDVESQEAAHLQRHQAQQEEFDRQFQERERTRWQEHLLQQQTPQQQAPQQSVRNSADSTGQRDRTSRDSQQARLQKEAKQERQRQQQEEALRLQRERSETQAAMQLISQLSKQASQPVTQPVSQQGGQ